MVRKKAEGTDQKDAGSIREQFDDLQRSLNRSHGISEPRGVFRFKTFKEFNEWKQRYHHKDTSPSLQNRER